LFKQTEEGIVQRDDGGNLVSAEQIARNLVSGGGQKRKSLKNDERKNLPLRLSNLQDGIAVNSIKM